MPTFDPVYYTASK